MARFERGKSGNPAGRPTGITDKRTILRAQLEGAAQDIVRTVVQSALLGDIGACKLLLDKVIPNARGQDLPVLLQAGSETADALSVEILKGLQVGAITPEQADRLTGALLNLARLREAQSLNERLQMLEQRVMSDG